MYPVAFVPTTAVVVAPAFSDLNCKETVEVTLVDVFLNAKLIIAELLPATEAVPKTPAASVVFAANSIESPSVSEVAAAALFKFTSANHEPIKLPSAPAGCVAE